LTNRGIRRIRLDSGRQRLGGEGTTGLTPINFGISLAYLGAVSLLRNDLVIAVPDGKPPASGTATLRVRQDGAMPRVCGHFIRDRRLFPLEDGVRRRMSLPAQRFGPKRRGAIRADA
jgi:hypothetical protein